MRTPHVNGEAPTYLDPPPLVVREVARGCGVTPSQNTPRLYPKALEAPRGAGCTPGSL